MASARASSEVRSPLAVVVVGYDDLAARTIEALQAASDMTLSAVLDDDPGRQARIAALGLPAAARAPVPCDVLVIRDGEESLVAIPAGATHMGPSAAVARRVERAGQERVPGADCLATRRVVGALGAACPAERIYLLILEHSSQVDCLTPRFGTANDTAGWLVGQSPALVVQRVQVPYDRSNVHVLKIDMRRAPTREDVLSALRAAPWVLVGRAVDGLPHTAAVQERRRDGGTPSSDGPELFVWEESVEVDGRRLVLTADVCPWATPVPETLQAVRLLGGRPG